MRYWRVVLVHQETGVPIRPGWTPSITPEELQEANHGLKKKELPWRWVLAPEGTAKPFGDSLQ